MKNTTPKGLYPNFSDFGITPATYSELERFTKEQSLGSKIKKFVWKANAESFAASKEFPYKAFLDKYCLPMSPHFLDDDSYYLIKNYSKPDVKLKAGRYIPKEEMTLRELKNKMPGSEIRYIQSQAYLFTPEGLKISCVPVKDASVAYPSDYVDPASVTNTGSFPRIINVTEDSVFLVETSKGKYESITPEQYNRVSDSVKALIDRALLKRELNLSMNKNKQ